MALLGAGGCQGRGAPGGRDERETLGGALLDLNKSFVSFLNDKISKNFRTLTEMVSISIPGFIFESCHE